MIPEPLLEVRRLSSGFTGNGTFTAAVKDVSFTLHRGETLGIVGESGSGKSVTALSLMRLLANPNGKIASGEIIYHGLNTPVDLLRISEKEMRKLRGNDLAMIFQEPMTSLNPVYTCGYQVMEALRLHRKLSRKAAQALTLQLFEEVKLPKPEKIAAAYPHQLSGGQKQRVMIAMAMSCQPAVLIADEPTTALDVTVQHTILGLMEDLQLRHRMGLLFITHDLGVIAEIADRVLVMYRGEIVEQGSVLELFTNPQHPYTKSLLACRPSLNRRPRLLPVVGDFMQTDVQGRHTEVAASVSTVLEKLAEIPGEREARQKLMYAQEPILKVENLHTHFPLRKNFTGRTTEWIKAVDGVSFEVYPGETLGLVGESGCGKTTLGRTLLKLIEPTAGRIVFQGNDITSLPEREMRSLRKNIQLIFQDPYSSLNPRMSIGEAIIEGMRVHRLHGDERKRRGKAIELLERVGLEETHLHRYPHEFSGGQRQRICIARCLALEPRFIVCDESVSALDVSVQAQVLNLLNALKKEFGLTYIFISHDLSVVKFMSDRMMVMNKGKIEEMGEADAMYAAPKSDYTHSLINAIPKGETEDILKHINRKKALFQS